MLIRQMQPSDLDFAASCTAAEGWAGETYPVFEGFLLHGPAGCLVAEEDNRPTGICVATSYGSSGFIGELIVIPEARGRGVGRGLLERAVAYLQECGARSVYLDGVLAAVPLYERVGFRKVCRSLRFAGRVQGRAHPQVRPMQPGDLAAVLALDCRAFGADRSFFLTRRLPLYPGLAYVLESQGGIAGYIMGRPAGGAVAVGPWLAGPEVERPVDLLEALAPEGGSLDVGIGVLETNSLAVATLRGLGLAERPDSPWRMVLGEPGNLGASGMLYAIGSPAKG